MYFKNLQQLGTPTDPMMSRYSQQSNLLCQCIEYCVICTDFNNCMFFILTNEIKPINQSKLYELTLLVVKLHDLSDLF